MKRLSGYLLATTALVSLSLLPAVGNPLDPNVVAGAASISGEGTPDVLVEQSTDKAIIDWRTFDIGIGETTQFLQPDVQSVTLNRVTGGEGASSLLGTLKANGQIFLVNPDGILIGKDATIDVGGLVATTHDIANQDFLAGDYRFDQPGNPAASIVNLGTITVEDSGFAALVAPGVRNAGIIRAHLGKIALTSANKFTLDFHGDGLLTLAIDDATAGTVVDVATGEPLADLVSNSGLLSADGGQVQLTATVARRVINSVINNTGNIEADSVAMRNGKIVLSAATVATKPSDAPTQAVKVSGTLSASGTEAGETGGEVEITGEVVELTVATVDAFGWDGGGTVLVGGDVGGGAPNIDVISDVDVVMADHRLEVATEVLFDALSSINASAISLGDGGKVILWADDTMSAHGTVSVAGGTLGGDGGFAEVSGLQELNVTNLSVSLSAPNGSVGTVLFDPVTFTVDLSNVATFTNILNQDGKAIIYGEHVSIETDIVKTHGAEATLKVFGDDGITIAPGVVIGAIKGKLNVLLDADADFNANFVYLSVPLPPYFREADRDYPKVLPQYEVIEAILGQRPLPSSLPEPAMLAALFYGLVYEGQQQYRESHGAYVPAILASMTGRSVGSLLDEFLYPSATWLNGPIAIPIRAGILDETKRSVLTLGDDVRFLLNGGTITTLENDYTVALDQTFVVMRPPNPPPFPPPPGPPSPPMPPGPSGPPSPPTPPPLDPVLLEFFGLQGLAFARGQLAMYTTSCSSDGLFCSLNGRNLDIHRVGNPFTVVQPLEIPDWIVPTARAFDPPRWSGSDQQQRSATLSGEERRLKAAIEDAKDAIREARSTIQGLMNQATSRINRASRLPPGAERTRLLREAQRYLEDAEALRATMARLEDALERLGVDLADVQTELRLIELDIGSVPDTMPMEQDVIQLAATPGQEDQAINDPDELSDVPSPSLEVLFEESEGTSDIVAFLVKQGLDYGKSKLVGELATLSTKAASEALNGAGLLGLWSVQEDVLLGSLNSKIVSAISGNANWTSLGTGVLAMIVKDAVMAWLDEAFEANDASPYMSEQFRFVFSTAWDAGMLTVLHPELTTQCPQCVAVVAAGQNALGQVIKAVDAAGNLIVQTEDMKAHLANLERNAEAAYRAGMLQKQAGNEDRARELFQLASNLGEISISLRDEYTIAGVSILDNEPWWGLLRALDF